jgi:hypothetical protein
MKAVRQMTKRDRLLVTGAALGSMLVSFLLAGSAGMLARHLLADDTGALMLAVLALAPAAGTLGMMMFSQLSSRILKEGNRR